MSRYDLSATTLNDLFSHASPGSLEEGYGHWLRGNLARENGDFDLALACYAHGRSIAETIGEPGLGILVRLGPGRCHRGMAMEPSLGNGLTMATWAGYHHKVNPDIIERHWAGDKNILELIQQILQVADEMVGSGLWAKAKRYV